MQVISGDFRSAEEGVANPESGTSSFPCLLSWRHESENMAPRNIETTEKNALKLTNTFHFILSLTYVLIQD